MTVRWINDNPFNPDLPLWTRAFAAELLPGPVTPLGWDLIWEGAAVLAWRDVFVDRLGTAPGELNDERPELIGVFGGHAYLNASALRVLAARTPGLAAVHFDAALGLDGHGLPPFRSEPWHVVPAQAEGPLTDWLSWVLVGRTQSELEAGRLLSLEAVAARPDLNRASDTELVDRALSLRPLCRALVGQHVNQTLAATIGPGVIAAVCDEIGQPTTATELLAGLGEIETASPLHGLWMLSRHVRAVGRLVELFDGGTADLSRRLRAAADVDTLGFLAGFDALLNEVGYRGSAEWDLGGTSWELEPGGALAAIDHMRQLPDSADPGRHLAGRETERADLTRQVGEVVASRPVTSDHFVAAMAATSSFVRGRSRSKANAARVVHEMRVAVRELGERAAARHDVPAPDDLTMLFADELAYYADGGLSKVTEIVAERLAHQRDLAARRPPEVIDGSTGSAPATAASDLSRTGTTPVSVPNPGQGSTVDSQLPLEQGEVLFGRAGADGLGRGRARVMTAATRLDTIAEGEVLVADLPLPSWLPLFVGAAGVVTDRGGVLSHTTVVARELGVPVVVGTRDGSARIPDGALVEVDGLAGIVTVVELPPSGAVFEDEEVVDPWGSRAY